MIRLSQRNLLTLLHGLLNGDSTFIIKPGIGPVTAESDDLCYKDRRPGRMNPATEAFIEDAEKWLATQRKPA
jgi:hypothetical protein